MKAPGHDTDEAWKRWGDEDPYFGVLTNERFRQRNLTAESKEEFFRLGADLVGHVIDTLRAHFDRGFTPRRVLDFGCGVGRLVIPFALAADEVVGMDVSEGMLAEARRNCEAIGLSNVTLVRSDDALSQLEGSFDLVHSVIVFQHIDPQRGRALFGRLLERIAPGGAGALQLTYAKRIHADRLGQPPVEHVARRSLRKLRALLAPRDNSDPEMQMNVYDLNQLMFMLQSAGVERVHTEFTDHGGELGVALYFIRPR